MDADGTPLRLIQEPVTVETAPRPSGLVAPARFRHRGEEHEVAEVLRTWQDHGYPHGTPRHSWLERRHRTYFRLRTTEGRLFDLYLDRTGNRAHWQWYLAREVASRGEPQ